MKNLADWKIKIVEDYPHLFREIPKDDPYFDIEVQRGWEPIVRAMCHCIDSWRRTEEYGLERAKESGPDTLIEMLQTQHDSRTYPKIDQIKQKLGELRIYSDLGPDIPKDEKDYIYGAMNMAEAWADGTCEMCGAPGSKQSANY